MREQRGNRIGQTGRKRSRPGLQALPLFPIALILLCSLGCPGTNRFSNTSNNKNEDPLLGGYKPKTTTTETKSPVPPIPQTSSTTSNAAMATALPLDGGRPLLIPDKDAKPLAENSTNNAAPGNNSPWTTQSGNSSQKPALGPPQPISKQELKNVPAVGAMQGNTPPPPPSQGGELGSVSKSGMGFAKPETTPVLPVSYDLLQLELKKRGVRWQKQETVDNGVRFLCGVPHPKNAKAERVIEAIAPDLPRAIMGALEKIDQP